MSRAHEMHGFLPDEYVELKAQRRTNILWALIFVVVAAGIGWAYFIAQTKVHNAEELNRSVNAEFAAAAKPIEQFQKLQAEQQRLNRQAEIAHSLVEKVNRSNILAQLTNSLPKSVYLSEFSLDGKRSESVATAGMTAYQRQQMAKNAGKGMSLPEPITYHVTMRVKGLAVTDKLVVDYINNLAKSPLFKEVNFVTTEAATYKEQKLRAFELDVVLDPTADTRVGAPVQSASAE